MSQFNGYKCDVCGKIIETGLRLRGDKRQEISGNGAHHSYRIDFCDSCYSRMIQFIKENKVKE